MSWALVGAAAVTVGGKIIGGAIQNKGINKAVDKYSAGATEAGAILDKGYQDARTAKLDALTKIGALTPEQLQQTMMLLQQGQTDYVDTLIASAESYAQQMGDGGAAYRVALTGAGAQYGADINQVVEQYGNEITQLATQLGVDFNTAAQVFKQGLDESAGQFGTELTGAATDEAAGLEGAAGQYGDTRMKGLNAITSAMTPYVEGRGTVALDTLTGQAAQDPSAMDPAQTRMRESFLRDSAARLAASGLRGAGRAGVAAVNEGDAELRARLYTENRDRATAAAGTLANYGYGASGQVGRAGEAAYTDAGNVMLDARGRGVSAISSAKQRSAQYGADTRATGLQSIYSAADRGAAAREAAGRDAASKRVAAGEDVAKTQLNLGATAALNDQDTARKIAGVDLDIGGKIATQGVANNSAVIAANDRAYDQSRDVAGKEGDANADAILGSAGANAGAVADPAWIAAQAELAKSGIKAETLGSVASSVADLLKPKPKPKTPEPSTTSNYAYG